MKKWMESAIMAQNAGKKATEQIEICTAILNIFHAIPAASYKLLEPLVTLSVRAESALSIEVCDNFTKPVGRIEYSENRSCFYILM